MVDFCESAKTVHIAFRRFVDGPSSGIADWGADLRESRVGTDDLRETRIAVEERDEVRPGIVESMLKRFMLILSMRVAV